MTSVSDADLAAALGALGATAGEVAATLECERCLGVPADCTACPVAEYLARRFAPLTPAVAEFVEGFDLGRHPHLDRGAA